MKALRGTIIVKREIEEKVTAGWLYIPDIAQTKPQVGEVVAVGKCPGLEDEIKVGDKVFFTKVVNKFKYQDEWFHTIPADYVEGLVYG